MKKLLAVLLCIALVLSLFTACQGKKEEGSDGAVTIRLATFQVGVNASAPWFASVIEAFNEEYAGKITLDIEEIPGDQAYVDKMKTYISMKDLPDLVFTGGYNLMDDALAANALVDLTPYFDADQDFASRFFEDDIEYNSRDGKIYGVPVERQPITYFYNKQLFEKAGITAPAATWDEFMKQLEQLKAAGVTPVSMDTLDSAWLSSLWLNSMVGTFSDESNQWTNQSMPKDYNSADFIKATDYVQKMLLNYTTKDALGGKYENGANNFLNGNTAMIANGPWMIGDFYAKGGEEFVSNIGTALYPEGGIFSGSMPGYLIGSKDKEHADAAVEFLKFITREDMQLKAVEMYSAIPANKNVEISQTVIDANPLLGEIVELQNQAAKVYGNYQSLWYSNVISELDRQYPLLAAGSITPEQFAQALTDAANKN
ncbi:ABC transporter substrate-binding protein [Sinanaerobacter chloroacetimidivorans]|jgi:raffinose/stachyose/melibiose transport system substrate-binding protein|uniref:Extracellular solute-binding protein n=1 Tax=Sinanaerobacter chloroacetimidivorans TaxID=2818044 RepID=A0A8J7W017_9FIRM|nr:extracellular solute-binding protein [Sinanaerobacter chloroacetimidivorans]MBR0596510.1 extracellular solute-binding protein [Sinanaerobacter chloroacetimidivorans]